MAQRKKAKPRKPRTKPKRPELRPHRIVGRLVAGEFNEHGEQVGEMVVGEVNIFKANFGKVAAEAERTVAEYIEMRDHPEPPPTS